VEKYIGAFADQDLASGSRDAEESHERRVEQNQIPLIGPQSKIWRAIHPPETESPLPFILPRTSSSIPVIAEKPLVQPPLQYFLDSDTIIIILASVLMLIDEEHNAKKREREITSQITQRTERRMRQRAPGVLTVCAHTFIEGN